MGALLVIGGVILLAVLAYIFIHGTPSTPGHGTGDAAGQATSTIGKAWDTLANMPDFFNYVAAAIMATLAIMTWRRIGGWGRGALLVGAGIFLAMTLGHRR